MDAKKIELKYKLYLRKIEAVFSPKVAEFSRKFDYFCTSKSEGSGSLAENKFQPYVRTQ